MAHVTGQTPAREPAGKMGRGGAVGAPGSKFVGSLSPAEQGLSFVFAVFKKRRRPYVYWLAAVVKWAVRALFHLWKWNVNFGSG
jgi:hypothetical protein